MGVGRTKTGLIRGALDAALVSHFLEAPECGAQAMFVGSVRSENKGRTVSRIDFDAYEPLAERELSRIALEACERWGAPLRAAILHRVGAVAVGDIVIALGAASPHRGAAFEACRFLIEEVKARVPIWKHEHYADGSSAWLEGTPLGSR